MYLMQRTALDPRWTTHHTPVVASFMLASFTAKRKDPGAQPVYDQNTGEWSGTFTDVFSGKARIQPYGIIGDEMVAQDPTGRRLMRVQVDNRSTGIQVDDMIFVTDCPDDPELLNYYLEVRGTIASSNAWVTDIVCEANVKWLQ